MILLNGKNLQVSAMFLAVLVILTLVIDFEKNQTGSTYNLLVSTMNVIVMGILTYYIYKVNKRVVDISEANLEFIKLQMKNNELKESNALLGKLDLYIKHNEIVNYVTLPHLTYTTKKRILISKRPELFEDIKTAWFEGGVIQWKQNMGGTLDEEEQKHFDYINKLFKNTLPNSVKARYKLSDVKKSFDYLTNFIDDHDYYRFKKNSEYIKDNIGIIETLIDEIFSNNEDLIIPNLDVNMHYAEMIHNRTESTKELLINLKGLIIEEQQNTTNL